MNAAIADDEKSARLLLSHGASWSKQARILKSSHCRDTVVDMCKGTDPCVEASAAFANDSADVYRRLAQFVKSQCKFGNGISHIDATTVNCSSKPPIYLVEYCSGIK